MIDNMCAIKCIVYMVMNSSEINYAFYNHDNQCLLHLASQSAHYAVRSIAQHSASQIVFSYMCVCEGKHIFR